jgi:hypothetical protein
MFIRQLGTTMDVIRAHCISGKMKNKLGLEDDTLLSSFFNLELIIEHEEVNIRHSQLMIMLDNVLAATHSEL